jgi:hypothetical protein
MTKTELPENLAEAFEYLDELRESGETNMFGARPYVQSEMGYDLSTAGAVLSAWMDTFDREKPPADRAEAARAKSAA